MGGVRQDFIDWLFAADFKPIGQGSIARVDLLQRSLRGGYPADLGARTDDGPFGQPISKRLVKALKLMLNLKGLHALAAAAGERFKRSIVLHTGATAIPFGENLFAMPVAECYGNQQTPRSLR